MKDKILPDTWLFKQTFSKLTASPQIIQEVIDMTETKKRPKKFVLRRLVVAALVLALAFALAMGANAATDGKLFESIVSYTLYGDDGTCYQIAMNANALKQAEEDGTIIYSFTEKEGEKTLMGYKDSEGNFCLEEIELHEDPKETLKEIMGKIETEKFVTAEDETEK